MTQDNHLAFILEQAHAHLRSASYYLNQACQSDDAWQLEYKHLRLLRTTRSNTARMDCIVRKLIGVTNRIANPAPILPGFEDTLLTAEEDRSPSQSPHNAALPPSE